MGRNQRITIYFLALAVGMIIVDSTIVNVAMPTIIKKLGISSGQAQWVQEIYTLIFASTLLIFGRMADRLGRRKIFIIGNFFFGVFSLVAALAQSAEILILARALQGIGAAMILPSSLSIINTTFSGASRKKALAVWGAVIGGSAAIGPFIGGYLVTSFTWRWAFGLNIPVVLIILIGAISSFDKSKAVTNERFDVLGSALALLTFSSMVFVLIEGRNYGWTSGIILSGAALSIFSFSLFLFLEKYRSAHFMTTYVDLEIWNIRSFRTAVSTSLIVSLGEYGLLFLLPYWLQNVLGYSGFKTGSLFLILALGSFLASGAARRAFRNRSAIEILQIGITLEVVGVALLGLIISPTTNILLIISALFIYGVGIGLATTQVTSIALQDVPTEKSGQASGISSTMRQIGFGMGIAVLGSLLFGLMGRDFSARLNRQGQLAQIDHSALVHQVVTSAGTVIPKLHGEVAQAAIGALTSASKWSSLAATVFLILGWLAVNKLRKTSKRVKK